MTDLFEKAAKIAARKKRQQIALILTGVLALLVWGAVALTLELKEMKHRRMQEAVRHDLTAVENAVYADLRGLAPGSLAAQTAQKEAVTADTPLEVISKESGISFRLIPAGDFLMGTPESEQLASMKAESSRSYNREHPQRNVIITKPFYCGKYEVTQGQWERVMGSNPSYNKQMGSAAPVEMVSWNDCHLFLKKLCALEGVPEGTYRLLTEAQWEYACRAGTTTAFSYGDGRDQLKNYSAENSLFGDGLKGKYQRTTIAVGRFEPNAFGLYDMHGNVWEWCSDWFGDYDAGKVKNPTGSPYGTYRVLRGGSWSHTARICRSAHRFRYRPDFKYGRLGLRLCRSVPSPPADE